MLRCRSALLALLITALSTVPVARGADLADQAHSLKFVPRDAAIYSASLRLREQIEIVRASNWWQRVQQVPVLQIGLMQAEQAWFTPPTPELEQIKEWIESEQGQQVVATVSEMMSDEVFLYADGDVTKLFELMLEFQSQMNSQQMQAGGAATEEQMKAIFRDFFTKHKDDLRVPDMVMGFRIKDNDAATRHLDTLQGLIKQAITESPVPLDEHFSRITDSDHDLLVLELPSSMIPWDQVEAEIDDADFYDLLRRVMDGKSATVAFGRTGEFIVFSLGDTAEHLTSRESSQLLVDHPAIQRLARHAGERLVSIEFVSGEFLEAVNNNERSIKDLASTGKMLLGTVNITEDDREKIASDIDELADDIVKWLPQMGHMSGVSYLTDRGYEGYSYSWAEQPAWDATQKLSLLEHVGMNPAAFVVSRGKSNPQAYNKLVEWCGRITKDIETIAVSEADPDDWAQYLEAKQMVVPFLKRFDAANRDHLIPGMADGQSGLVIDLSVAEESWCDPMSPAKKPLAMPAFTLLMGVSDADAVKQGATEYYEIVQDILDTAHQLHPEEMPEIKLPEPTVHELNGATVYQFELDPSLGASPELAPHFAVGKSVAVLGYLPSASKGMLVGTSLSIDSPAADFDRPLFAAGHVDFNQLLDAAKPWIDYGFQVVQEKQLDEDNMSFFIRPQLEQIVELSRALRSFTAIVYFEDGAWVTRSELRVEDLK